MPVPASTSDQVELLYGRRRPVPWRRWVVARSVVVAVAAAVGVIVLYVLAVRTGVGQRFDDAVVIGRFEQRSWFRWSVVVRLTRRSDLPLLAGAAVAFGWAVWRRRYPQAVAAFVVIGGSFATTEILKKLVLPRPLLTTTHPFNSYPSGHTTVAVAVAVGLILVAPQRWRGRVGVVVGVLATLVANGTLAIGWHRPSDAIGACMVVLAWTGATVAGLVLVGAASRSEGARARQLSRGTWVLAALCVACGIPGVWQLGDLLGRLRDPSLLGTEELKHLYNTADLLVLASVTGAVAIALVLLQGVTLDRWGAPGRARPPIG